MRPIRTGSPLSRLSRWRRVTTAAFGLTIAAMLTAVAGTDAPATSVVLAAEPGTPRTPTLPAGNGGGAWWP
jgi:hypothetical protein